MKNLIIFGAGAMFGSIGIFLLICEGMVEIKKEDTFSLTNKGEKVLNGGEDDAKCN